MEVQDIKDELPNESWLTSKFLVSSVIEHRTVNARVRGLNPRRGAKICALTHGSSQQIWVQYFLKSK